MSYHLFRAETAKNNTFPADRNQIEAFIRVAFRNANQGFVQLRCFQQSPQKPVLVRWGGSYPDSYPIWPAFDVNDLEALIDHATSLATQCAALEPVAVFSPPVCTLDNPHRARCQDLAEGLCVRVECDAEPVQAHKTLTGILGPTTLTVLSGGRWEAPDGHIEDKRHLYWRLGTPTHEQADHERLRDACKLACLIVGADATAVAAVHPLRWPGSWHRKAQARMAEIEEFDDRDVNLDDVLATLRAAATERGLVSERPAAVEYSPEDVAEDRLMAAFNAINPHTLRYDDWLRLGFAFATLGNLGHRLWHDLSSTHHTYTYQSCEAKWRTFSPNGATQIGTLFHYAKLGDPEWWSRYYAEQRAIRQVKTEARMQQYLHDATETHEYIKELKQTNYV